MFLPICQCASWLWVSTPRDWILCSFLLICRHASWPWVSALRAWTPHLFSSDVSIHLLIVGLHSKGFNTWLIPSSMLMCLLVVGLHSKGLNPLLVPSNVLMCLLVVGLCFKKLNPLVVPSDMYMPWVDCGSPLQRLSSASGNMSEFAAFPSLFLQVFAYPVSL